jgi:hypothetical protein
MAKEEKPKWEMAKWEKAKREYTEWLGCIGPEGRGFESPRRHGVVSVSRIP